MVIGPCSDVLGLLERRPGTGNSSHPDAFLTADNKGDLGGLESLTGLGLGVRQPSGSVDLVLLLKISSKTESMLFRRTL